MNSYFPGRITASAEPHTARVIVTRNREGGLILLIDGTTHVRLPRDQVRSLVRSILVDPETALELAAQCSSNAVGMLPGQAEGARESVVLAHLHAAAERAAGWYESLEVAPDRHVPLAALPAGVSVSERVTLMRPNIGRNGR